MNFRRLNLAGLIISTAGYFLLTSFANATTYILSVDDPASNLGSGPYGTISVTQDVNGTSLDITETLNAGFKIHAGNGNHHAIDFSLAGNPTISVSGLTAGFSLVSTAAGSVSAPPFGNFDYAITCTGCGPGFAGGLAGPLSFVLSGPGTLTLSSLEFDTYNGSNIYFASDVVDSAGNTGNAGAILASAVPEPSTWAMMILGFVGFGFVARRRGSTIAPISAS